ncbi:SpaH/EbpB family LPXTG-anchored major pilin [Lacticaseibacillus jixianensis]|uniref:SpaH/EbpB family LPXTG-anchored major pilin n=1 Tax=Lacticaseibacillus jixianensis TaxID=2486012 RepID=A0ABW4BCM3_9LACO|nr:SpaH/EbpB family LPXTG-anchored major pilin [Lacticaseibacillus jixianensis]
MIMGKKLKHILASALLILPLALSAATSAAQLVTAGTSSDEVPDSVQVNLHKVAFSKDPDKETNPVKITDNYGNAYTQLPDGAKPLNGVEFTAYDITSDYQALISQGTKSEDAVQQLQQQSVDGLPDNAQPVVHGSQTTAGGTEDLPEGLAQFNLKTKTTIPDPNGKTATKSVYATYVIKETKSSVGTTITTEKATPMVLVMPLYNKYAGESKTDSKMLSQVDLYPKNVTETSISKDLTDPTDNNKSFGDSVQYKITVQVPNDIAAQNSFYVTDTPDLGLDDDINSISIKDSDTTSTSSALTKGTDYTVTPTSDAEKGAGFKITFIGDAQKASDAFKAEVGETLTITYNAKVTKAAPVGDLNNYVGLNHTPNVKSNTPVITGGAKFVKEDAEDSNKKLAGAEFELAREVNGKRQYAHQDKDGNYSWDENEANAVTTPSKDDGSFEFTGLEYSESAAKALKVDPKNFTYEVIETKAPAGYAKLLAPQTFTVDDNSYTNQITIKDAPAGFLPHTGGMGIYLVIAAGLIVMIAGALFLKKGNRHEEV